MGLLQGLDAINQRLQQDAASKGQRVEREKVDWFSLKDGQSARFRYAQELDKGATGFDQDAGLGIVAVEHVSPFNYQRRSRCLADTGPCRGCEEHRKNPKAGWKPKLRLLINILVEQQDGTYSPKVLTQGYGPKTAFDSIIEDASENGTLTDGLRKMKRTGGGLSDTSYTITKLKADASPFDVSEYKLFNLDDASITVAYDDQNRFYQIPGEGDEAPAAKEDDSQGSFSETEW